MVSLELDGENMSIRDDIDYDAILFAKDGKPNNFTFLRSISTVFYSLRLYKVYGAQTLYLLITNKILDEIVGDGSQPFLVNTKSGKMFVDGKDSIGIQLIRRGIFEVYETSMIRERLQPGMVFVDCGANIGCHTLVGAETVGSRGRVYAFEPDATNYEMLTQNVKINGFGSIVTTINKAVSNKTGTVKLYSDKIETGVSSLERSNIPSLGCEASVKMVSLDDYFGTDRVDFIKIDIQGAEELLVDGARGVLENNDLEIMMEFWPHGLRGMGSSPLGLLNKLMDCGFQLMRIDSMKKRMVDIEPADAVNMCDGSDYIGDFINIFLKKH